MSEKERQLCKRCGIEIDHTDICLDLCNWCAMEDGTLDTREMQEDET
jgi:NMD protein affecting ribosome stability and mRNA decay